MSRRQLTERSGVSSETIKALERHGASANLKTANRLARSLGVPHVSDLFRSRRTY
jgi:DNA-binding XRE family transcriptional regulator